MFVEKAVERCWNPRKFQFDWQIAETRSFRWIGFYQYLGQGGYVICYLSPWHRWFQLWWTCCSVFLQSPIFFPMLPSSYDHSCCKSMIWFSICSMVQSTAFGFVPTASTCSTFQNIFQTKMQNSESSCKQTSIPRMGTQKFCPTKIPSIWIPGRPFASSCSGKNEVVAPALLTLGLTKYGRNRWHKNHRTTLCFFFSFYHFRDFICGTVKKPGCWVTFRYLKTTFVKQTLGQKVIFDTQGSRSKNHRFILQRRFLFGHVQWRVIHDLVL